MCLGLDSRRAPSDARIGLGSCPRRLVATVTGRQGERLGSDEEREASMQTGTRVTHVHRGDGWTGTVVRMAGPSTVAVLWDAGAVTEVVNRYALRLTGGMLPGTVADTPSRRRMRRDHGASEAGLAFLMAVMGVVVLAILAAYAAKRGERTPSPVAPTVADTRLVPDCSWATLRAQGGEYAQCVSDDETRGAYAVHDGIHAPVPLAPGDAVSHTDDQGRTWYTVAVR